MSNNVVQWTDAARDPESAKLRQRRLRGAFIPRSRRGEHRRAPFDVMVHVVPEQFPQGRGDRPQTTIADRVSVQIHDHVSRFENWESRRSCGMRGGLSRTVGMEPDPPLACDGIGWTASAPSANCRMVEKFVFFWERREKPANSAGSLGQTIFASLCRRLYSPLIP